MSDLQRHFAKAKLAAFPLPDSLEEEDGEDDETDGFAELPVEQHTDDDSSSASSASSTGTIRPAIGKNLFARPQG